MIRQNKHTITVNAFFSDKYFFMNMILGVACMTKISLIGSIIFATSFKAANLSVKQEYTKWEMS